MNILRYIQNSSLLVNTLKMSASNILMYMLPVIVIPVLTRIYTPADFGEWGVFSALIGIAGTGLLLSMENAIIRAENEEELTTVSLLCLVIGLLISASIMLLFVVGRWAGIEFCTTFPDVVLLFIYLIVSVAYTILYNIANKKESYNTLSICSIVQGVAQAVFRIALGVMPFMVLNGLITGTVLAQLIVAILLGIAVFGKEGWKPIFSGIGLNYLASTLRKYSNFIIFDTPSNLLSFAAFNLPIIILSSYYSKHEIGCYSIVLQLLLIPMSFLGSALGRVYYQQLCTESPTKEHIKDSSSTVVRITTYISIIPMLALAVGGDKLLSLFLGNQWSNTSLLALCLSLWAFPVVLTQPLLPLFRYTDRLKTLFGFEATYSVFVISIIIVGCRMGASLSHILIMYGCSTLIVKMVLFAKVMRLSSISLSFIARPSILWFTALAILTVRLYNS